MELVGMCLVNLYRYLLDGFATGIGAWAQFVQYVCLLGLLLGARELKRHDRRLGLRDHRYRFAHARALRQRRSTLSKSRRILWFRRTIERIVKE
jgi:hypothetical protein